MLLERAMKGTFKPVFHDGRTIFAGIQHPGSSWPDGEGLPRSAIVAIRREDAAVIA